MKSLDSWSDLSPDPIPGWCNFRPIISIDALCILSQSIYSIKFSQFMTIENKIKLKFFFHVHA